ncbi:hypothetical protein KI387_030830 [Taxus chinensis]|uniref:BAG domain-containing protein n=1 Tax=Taxus chinensis TaxID=29808 RepID=A0AA38CM73_TAXCH|nr:hypothetical protein KI387_030830 [Taxus chinensis]
MDNPFFGGVSNGVPRQSPSNVVSIPVNFVNSSAAKSASTAAKQAATRKRMNETTSAVKIQAAFRGFCVRKTQPFKKLRVIMKTKAEAAEIRRRIADCHFVELIRRDEKERLKLTEFVMSLLLRLDAILGVNSFVRESRKAVTHELVNLQETIDDIIADKSMQAMTTEARVSSEREEESPNVNENAPVDAGRESPMKKSKTTRDKLPKKEESIKDIAVVREENKRLKRTVSDPMKKSEIQTEMINNVNLQMSQLEGQVSQCGEKEKIGDRKKQSSSSTEKRTAQPNDRKRKSKMDRHLKNSFKKDWFRVSSFVFAFGSRF